MFEIRGLETHEVLDEKTGFNNLLFRSPSGDFFTVLKWEPMEFLDVSFWVSISERVKTLLYNRVSFEDKYYETEAELRSFIESRTPKYSPQEKLDMVLEFLHGRTSFDGERQEFKIETELERGEIWRKFYFNNGNEFVFYLDNLLSQGLLECQHRVNGGYLGMRLTLNGLTQILKITESMTSKICFVAMSFDDTLKPIFDDAILPALSTSGFVPYIVNKQHLPSDQTINDAILAGIKKAHFTIADFTQHKAGVYFEAGFALGRGQKVIYTCHTNDIDKAHFDTRSFQHIVWTTTEELKLKLIDKIEVFIKS